ncbi:MAG: glutamate--tRNA ligase [Chloroflexi bacterium]|nr:glutamate--tRNA ligase [Chloroflexota bacterium]
MTPVRVRFAPSPTGHFHIGGARTALYNYLLARQTGGQFILRVEDTDRKRSAPEYYDELLTALHWLGLQWDEGPDVGGPHAPYNQLARREIYQQHAQQLLASGHAYRCFCTPERLKSVRKEQQQRKEPFKYDGHCRRLLPSESEARAGSGESFVIRFSTPQEGVTTAHDRLRGDITVENRNLDDFIIVKSDGLALYHLAAMLDDHLMGITHVFRGAEWLSTFPLHALLIRAFGWQEPVWVHLSVFLNPSGKGKMSKRHLKSEQEIFVLGLRDQGYVPEAVINWIALMGASFGPDETLLPMEEMIARFDLDHLNPSPARVNFEKLDHFNGAHIRRLAPADLAGRIRPYFEKVGLRPDDATLQAIAPLVQERLVTLDDAVDFAGFFFREDVFPDPATLVGKGMTPAQSAEALRRSIGLLSALPAFAHAEMETPMRSLAEELGLKPGQLFGILRMAVTGQAVSPPLFECMEVLGRETTLARLRQAEETLKRMA